MKFTAASETNRPDVSRFCSYNRAARFARQNGLAYILLGDYEQFWVPASDCEAERLVIELGYGLAEER